MVNVYNKKTKTIEREGEPNRERIFEIIFKNKDNGTRPIDIIKETDLSKQTVHPHLNKLLNKKRIYKQGHRYYPENHILNEIINFCLHMKECIPMLIGKAIIESDPWAHKYLKRYPKQGLYKQIKIDLPKEISVPLDTKLIPDPDLRMYFLKMVLGSTISKEYCRTNFGPEKSLEKCLFEFSNRIGMYITYILTQALYPLDLNISHKERIELSRTLINKSISTEELFDAFRQLISELGLAKCDLKTDEHRELFQLSNENFKTLSNTIRIIYPKIYDGLENWWFNSTSFTLKVNTLLAMNSKCPHIWKELYLFKYSPSYVCSKCQCVTAGPTSDKNLASRRK